MALTHPFRESSDGDDEPAQSRLDQSDVHNDRECTTAPPGTLKANEQDSTAVDRHVEPTLEQFKQLNFILGDCVL